MKHEFITEGLCTEKGGRINSAAFLYKENHALDAWFDKVYGDEEKTIWEDEHCN